MIMRIIKATLMGYIAHTKHTHVHYTITIYNPKEGKGHDQAR